MSKADKKRVAEIQNILNVDETTAIEIFKIIEDYFDPKWSRMTEHEFCQLVKAANEGFIQRIIISNKKNELQN